MPKMRKRKKAKVAMAPSALFSLADSAWRLQRGGGGGGGGGRYDMKRGWRKIAHSLKDQHILGKEEGGEDPSMQRSITAHLVFPPPRPSPPPSLPASLEDGEEKQLNLREHGRATQQYTRGDGGLDPGKQGKESKPRNGEGCGGGWMCTRDGMKDRGSCRAMARALSSSSASRQSQSSFAPLYPWQMLPCIPLEDDRAADEDAHQQDHGPNGRKRMRVRRTRGLALREAGRNDQG